MQMLAIQAQNLEKLEIKREVLTEKEKEESTKKLKIFCENDEDKIDEKYQCHICWDFAHNPINCSKCLFKACKICFDEYRQTQFDEYCPQGCQIKPEKNLAFLDLREDIRVLCQNEECPDPNQKIPFKHYQNHLILCLKKQYCPNGCGIEFKSLDKAKIHLAECKQCKHCLEIIDLQNISIHDCQRNIQNLKNQNINLKNFIKNYFQNNSQYIQLNQIFEQELDNRMTFEQIELYKKLGKMTVQKIIENSKQEVDLNDNNLKIQKVDKISGSYSYGQIDQNTGKMHGINRKYYITAEDEQKRILYEGQFVDGFSEGYGREIFPSGKFYEGQYKVDKKDGIGKFFYRKGQIYEGEWKQGQRDGLGSFYYNDGRIYKGVWKNDKKHGKGKIIDKDGNILKIGNWIDGVFKP